tara:strand:+ start:55 stop:387 length:333 start_codon:yes stop_codon:yes gene_type:complete
MEKINEEISKYITDNDIGLFMKGNPTFPQCGFSATVVQVLKHLGAEFKSHDVLSEPGLRDGIKQFSNWPTIPQLYIKGDFFGGCDIIKEMFESGELKTTLQNQGIKINED